MTENDVINDSDILNRIHKWRLQRTRRIATNQGLIQNIADSVKFIFHVIPESAFSSSKYQALAGDWKIDEGLKHHLYVPATMTNARYNGDGFLVTSEAGAVYAYTQLFRSGTTEYLDAQCSGPIQQNGKMVLFGARLDAQISTCFQDALKRNGDETSLYVGFALVGIFDKDIFYSARQTFLMQKWTSQQDVFTSPELRVDVKTVGEPPYKSTLEPLVNLMWQLFGHERSRFFRNGIWDWNERS